MFGLMILNRQQRVRVPVKNLERFFSRARRALRLPADSFTVCLVTNVEIARWNRVYRGKSGPTDVLSFPIDAKQNKQRKAPAFRGRFLPATSSASYLGDIAIAPAVARRNARRLGRT